VTNSTYISIKGSGRKGQLGKDVFFCENQSILCRYIYLLKIYKVYHGLKVTTFNPKNSIIHAHTLYSDGIPAYLYSKKHMLDLVVTLRTTDVHLGFKYLFHYKWLARKTLAYAKRIVFVAPAHKVKFQQYFGNCYDHKLFIIPNGIDKFYLENTLKSAVNKSKNRVALYVGTINKNKNLQASITAFFNISISNDDEFRVVGGTYKEYVDIYGELPVNLIHRVNFLGELSKEQVLDQMRDSTLFIMVSHSETFGLVYIEAISQCLPIVYTLGQGVDGYFKDGEFGYRANSNDIDSISQAISKTTSDFPHGLGPFIENPANNFSWESIATIYKEQVYK
jgi:glycosyltransferase involved in cell wall biosynthesis